VGERHIESEMGGAGGGRAEAGGDAQDTGANGAAKWITGT
jgi:hypothetical protein